MTCRPDKTHHHACDCREEHFRDLESQLSQVQGELERLKEIEAFNLRKRMEAEAERDALKAEKAGLLKMLENRQKRMSVYREALENILNPHPHKIDYTWDKGHIINGRVKKCMAIEIAKQALSSNEGA